MNIFIPSKNRAAQLDLLLTSIEQNCPLFENIIVCFKADNIEYKEAYNECAHLHRNAIFVPEQQQIRTHLLQFIDECKSPLFCICTDDTVFYYPSPVKSAKELEKPFSDPHPFLCFSFRLGFNTVVQDYKTNRLQAPLSNYVLNDKTVSWKWTEYHPLSNYGYASGQDAVAYHTPILKSMVKNIFFKTLRDLESHYALGGRYTLFNKPMMTSFTHSIAVNIPANAVQGGLYHSEVCYMSTEELNKKFLDGDRISLAKMNFSNICGSHKEIEYVY